jgi:predicted RNase H-like HicB family nuclease
MELEARDGGAFEVVFNLLRRIDDGEDIVFFADEGGSWQVGVDWKVVFSAWFACLAQTATPEEYARRVVQVIEDLDEPDQAKHMAEARRAAMPAHRRALAKQGRCR